MQATMRVIYIENFNNFLLCGIIVFLFQLLLHLVQHYPTPLSHVMLEENEICEETKYSIRIALGESASEASSDDDEPQQPEPR